MNSLDSEATQIRDQRLKGNIFFPSPDLKFVLLCSVKKGHTKGIRLPAGREQMRLL